MNARVWLTAVCIALCCPFVGVHAQGPEATFASHKWQQPLDPEAAAASDQRSALELPTRKQAKHGKPGNPVAVVLTSSLLQEASIEIPSIVKDAVCIFRRRLATNAPPRAPPG